MGRIKGITVTLYTRTADGYDAFGAPVYKETAVDVGNVLVAPSSDTDVVNAMQLYGKKAVYTLGIPKGDEHDWEDVAVGFFGKKWRTFGFGSEGIDGLIPLGWTKKVMVERYG